MMEETSASYLSGLRARHAADLELLKAALAGRRPRALRAIARRQAAIERETAGILVEVEARERENSDVRL